MRMVAWQGARMGADASMLGVSDTSQDYFSPLTVYNNAAVTIRPGTAAEMLRNEQGINTMPTVKVCSVSFCHSKVLELPPTLCQ